MSPDERGRPTLADALNQLRASGTLPPEEVARYQANADFFDAQRNQLTRDHPGQFAAAVEGQVIVAATRRELREQLKSIPHSERSYCEQLEGSYRSENQEPC